MLKCGGEITNQTKKNNMLSETPDPWHVGREEQINIQNKTELVERNKYNESEHQQQIQ